MAKDNDEVDIMMLAKVRKQDFKEMQRMLLDMHRPDYDK